MTSTDNAEIAIQEILDLGISAHRSGEIAKLSAAYEDFDSRFGLYDGGHKEWIHYVRNFLDNWIDSANHDWKYHEPISKDDWVPLAEILLNEIKSGKSKPELSLRGQRINAI